MPEIFLISKQLPDVIPFRHQVLVDNQVVKTTTNDQAIKQWCHEHSIDYFISPNLAPKKLLIADMDSTIVEQETLDDVANYAGLGEQVAKITARAMAGEIDFITALEQRLLLLRDQSTTLLAKALTEVKITSGAEQLMAVTKNLAMKTVLCSGGFTYFTQYIADKLGFDHHYGNELIINNGLLSGYATKPYKTSATKVEVLEKYKTAMNINYDNIIAIGDGANDIPMLEKAGLGVGFHAKPLVAKLIPQQIRFGDLAILSHLLRLRTYNKTHGID
jgi:phosphoserine phosphatase